jgi:flagellar biosynthesis protein FlhF
LDLKVESFIPDISVQKGDSMPAESLEKKLDSLQRLIEKQMSDNSDKEPEKPGEEKSETEPAKIIQTEKTDKLQVYKDLIYKQLVDNEVESEIADNLIHDIEHSLPENATVDHILSDIYQKIILTLGRPYTIKPQEDSTKFIFFLGSTGVGKTTTIAKIASRLKLHDRCKIALVTADTYRIAAVEQLKTYANILGIYLKVVYTPAELKASLPELREYDVCLIDTAGRSHHNKEQIEDIRELLDQVPISEREAYLVMNVGTKYKNQKEIAEVYSEITDYSIIFTKLDEASSMGVLLNLKVITKCPLSYVTWGQNVPDDIGELDPQKTAKELLGGKS